MKLQFMMANYDIVEFMAVVQCMFDQKNYYFLITVSGRRF